jgi:hypothetical protein
MSALCQKRTFGHCSRTLKQTLSRVLFNGGQPEKVRMAGSDDWKKAIRRNKLLGMWAAEKLGMTGQEADAYSDARAAGTLDPERSDVLSKIRKDFDAAGGVQSDEEILRVMNELTLQAGNQMPGTGGPTDACSDARAPTQVEMKPVFSDAVGSLAV